MASKKQVEVRGSCPQGHVTQRLSDPGRLTWEGECGQDGCTERVKARRVPGDRVPPAPPPGSGNTGTTEVIRIEEFDDTSSGARDDHGGPGVADVPAPQLEPDAAPASEVRSGPADPIDPERRGFLARLRERRAGRPARSRNVPGHPFL